MNISNTLSRCLFPIGITFLLSACGGGGTNDGGDLEIYDGPDTTVLAGSDDDIPFSTGATQFRPLKDVLDELRANSESNNGVVEETIVQDDIDITVEGTRVFIAGGSLLDVITVDIASTNLAASLPQSLTQVGSAINITISPEDQALLNGPVQVTLHYDDADVQNENNLIPLYFDGNNFYPVTLISQDTSANTLTVDTRRVPTLLLTEHSGSIDTSFDTGFLASVNGWDINNFGTYFAPGGNSFGMSGYAAWLFSNGTLLNGLYSSDTARITAARIQMSQSETWGNQPWREDPSLGQAKLVQLIKTNINVLNQPIILMLGQSRITKAVLVYRYDSNRLYFYDPDIPNQEQFISINDGQLSGYENADTFGFATLSSFGQDNDFQALADEAINGFLGSENLSIDSPVAGQLIDAREVDLTGSLLNDLSETEDLYIEVKGVGRQIPVSEGNFSNVIEISNGINTIVALAGINASNHNNWYKNAPTVIREVEGTLPATKLLVTLTWEQNSIDVDLYVTEPNGESSWYSNSTTTNGLELDFDDTNGFGPEHTTLEVGSTDNPTADKTLDGEYIVRVHYYSDDGLGFDATGKVTIIINEGQANQDIRIFGYRISYDDAAANGPGGTGNSWIDVAKVNIINGTFSTDFSEPEPATN